jgi:hypothetical protein
VKPLTKYNVFEMSQANSQLEWLQWGVDFIGRFENLQEDWKRLCEIIEMPYVELPVSNRNEPIEDYRSYYDAATEKIVRDVYQVEIKRFGYTFQGVVQ